MKIIRILVVALSVFLICACGAKYKYPGQMAKGGPEYAATLDVNYSDMTLKIKNKSDKTMKVVWDDSAIINNGTSSQIIPTGTKFIDATDKKPDLVIPAGIEIFTSFSPSNKLYWEPLSKQWMQGGLTLGDYNVSLALKTGDKIEALNFNFKIDLEHPNQTVE